MKHSFRLALSCLLVFGAAGGDPWVPRPAVGQASGAASVEVRSEPGTDPAPERREAEESAHNHALDIRRKFTTDSIYTVHAPGAYEYEWISYPSSVGDLDIPALLFTPLAGAFEKKRPALVWVHGGVHSDWSATYLPFVKDAVSRGYVVIAPDYRGSTGYGPEYYRAIDYGGYEIDDVISAVDYLRRRVPMVDPDRIGIMGWSHGGFIAAHAVFREETPFRAALAVAPVANLIFRLAYKGPAYQALFSSQSRIGGLPHEVPNVYIERSPVYHVDKLRVPMMVQVATNDADVEFVESQQLIYALEARKPELSEIVVYEEPPGGHLFSRLVDVHHQPIQTPVMVDSWERAWEFFDRHLRPLVMEGE